MRVWKGIKDGVPATEKRCCVLKAPALKNFIVLGQAAEWVYHRRIAVNGCTWYLAQARAPLFYESTAGQTPFVYEGDCSSNRDGINAHQRSKHRLAAVQKAWPLAVIMD